jgi:hypothetical protein
LWGKSDNLGLYVGKKRQDGIVGGKTIMDFRKERQDGIMGGNLTI